MEIGVLKESKQQEKRVAITPKIVSKIKKLGHTVRVEKGLGLDANFYDSQYIEAGAGQTLEGEFYDGLALSSNSSWGSSPGEFTYPFVTATLFSAYYGPNEEGSYVTGSPNGGASSLPQIGNYDKLGNILTANHYFNFVTAKGNTADDIFEFTSSAPLASEDKKKSDLEMINVFPI